MARAYGVKEFEDKKFIEYNFTGKWHESLGNPETNFTAIIYGNPKNGKTEFCVMFAKYLTNFGKVLYNSIEQGISKSLQDAFKRQQMREVSGKIIVTHKETYDQMYARLKKKKSPLIVFIDSLQYFKITAEKFQELKNSFPKKVFIVISHAEGDLPKGGIAKTIQYDVCMSILVKGFNAQCFSRYGGGADFIIWEEGHRRYLSRQKKPAASPAKNKEATPQLAMEMQAV